GAGRQEEPGCDGAIGQPLEDHRDHRPLRLAEAVPPRPVARLGAPSPQRLRHRLLQRQPATLGPPLVEPLVTHGRPPAPTVGPAAPPRGGGGARGAPPPPTRGRGADPPPPPPKDRPGPRRCPPATAPPPVGGRSRHTAAAHRRPGTAPGRRPPRRGPGGRSPRS